MVKIPVHSGPPWPLWYEAPGNSIAPCNDTEVLHFGYLEMFAIDNYHMMDNCCKSPKAIPTTPAAFWNIICL